LFRESRSHSKQRKTLKQPHSDLAQLGFTDSNERELADSQSLVLLHNETLAVPAVSDSLAVEQPYLVGVVFCNKFYWNTYFLVHGLSCVPASNISALELITEGAPHQPLAGKISLLMIRSRAFLLNKSLAVNPLDGRGKV